MPIDLTRQRDPGFTKVESEVITLLREGGARLEEERRELRRRVDASRETEDARHRGTVASIQAAAEQALLQAEEAHESAVIAAERRYGSRRAAMLEQLEAKRAEREMACADALAGGQVKHEHQVWLAESIYEEREPRPRLRQEEGRAEMQVALTRIQSAQAAVAAHVQGCRFRMPQLQAEPATPAPPAAPPAAPSPALGADPATALRTACEEVERHLATIRAQGLPKLFRSIVPFVLCGGASLLGAGIGAAVGHIRFEGAIVPGAGAGGVGGLAIALVALAVVHRRITLAWRPVLLAVQEASATASAASEAWLFELEEERRRLEEENAGARDRAIAKSEAAIAPREAKLRADLARIKARLEEIREESLARYAEERETGLREAALARAAQVAEATHLRDTSMTDEHSRHGAAVASLDAHEEQSVRAMTVSWQACRDAVQSHVDDLAAATRVLLRPWREVAADAALPDRTPVAIPVATVRLDAAAVQGCQPQGRALEWRDGAPPCLEAAVTLQLPGRGGLLLECDAAARPAAIDALQAAMLRLLVLSPPGKVRFTIIDPVGLGQGFAGFMHLADHLEALVHDRIWTESRHIELRLAELTEHMETVIQKYLRDEFEDIEAYNAQAQEIAEPLRYLVVSDFPAAFSEVAVRRLNSIIDSGARCGVHVLLMRDTRAELPSGTDLDLLRSRLLRLSHGPHGWQLHEAGLDTLPIALGTPPGADDSMAIVNRVGRAAKASARVVVPFGMIAPREAEVWTRSTERSVSVELGRTGATRLQPITLGVGTAQHALIAGRTGSGKSTLLHAIITNLALWYSPDEVELWLIDFKKGVEFKAYATHRLPHARAVAVETDREFGLSVLQGLDAEMKRRGEAYRESGVQDLAGYRRARPGVAMPRVILIVDEFQELFVEDDKVGQDAALLLDRLVRQGRAFGMHVILGSQTLGGTYALPRTTMGQMGIRIALQCNEADASLILSDDNLAARGLSRPGEAIYNDAGGLLEGNSPFQVCWLEEEDRDGYLIAVRERFAATWPDRPSRMVVFEGSAPASWNEQSLRRRVREDAERAAGRSRAGVRIWLGDAVSIKEPTHVLLRRQSGANIVVVGQRDDAALGLATAMLGSAALASMAQGGALTVHVIDGIAPDEPESGHLAALHSALGLAGAVEAPRGAEPVLAELAAEVARRTAEGLTDEPPLLLLIHGLQRIRALRRNDDDFSYGGEDKPPTPDKLLAALLRDGPLVGVHVMMWADTVANLQRVVDRAGMRELDWRICFQMSNADSSTLIDSPAASRIGQHRALLASEEHGTMEKFRPFSAIDR